jgi:hypothetical protein
LQEGTDDGLLVGAEQHGHVDGGFDSGALRRLLDHVGHDGGSGDVKGGSLQEVVDHPRHLGRRRRGAALGEAVGHMEGGRGHLHVDQDGDGREGW